MEEENGVDLGLTIEHFCRVAELKLVTKANVFGFDLEFSLNSPQVYLRLTASRDVTIRGFLAALDFYRRIHAKVDDLDVDQRDKYVGLVH